MTPRTFVKNTIRKFVRFCFCAQLNCDDNDKSPGTGDLKHRTYQDSGQNCNLNKDFHRNDLQIVCKIKDENVEEEGRLKGNVNNSMEISDKEYDVGTIVINHCIKCCTNCDTRSISCNEKKTIKDYTDTKYIQPGNEGNFLCKVQKNIHGMNILRDHPTDENIHKKYTNNVTKSKEEYSDSKRTANNVDSNNDETTAMKIQISLSTTLEAKNVPKKSGKLPTNNIKNTRASRDANTVSRRRNRRRNDERYYSALDKTSIVSVKSELISHDSNKVKGNFSNNARSSVIRMSRRNSSKRKSFRRHALNKYHRMLKEGTLNDVEGTNKLLHHWGTNGSSSTRPNNRAEASTNNTSVRIPLMTSSMLNIRPIVVSTSSVVRPAPRGEISLVREAIGALRNNFRSTDPNQHILDTLEQAISIMMEKNTSSPSDSGITQSSVDSADRRLNGSSVDAHTKVIYFTERTVTPFMSTIMKALGEIKLKDFKAMFDRPGMYRYHFKNYDPEYGMVKEEIINDEDILPGVDGKITAWVEEDHD